jgi:hypothetical protein
MRVAVGTSLNQLIPWASNDRTNIATVSLLTLGYSFIYYDASTKILTVNPGYSI